MIHVLEKKVTDKIAAGEVIDRPVSIIKELLENSIDAGADNITVEIKNGGKSYIRVTDNGCGISPEDIETAFKRHATSKISSVKDLDSIITLGFRGEALASICAVSRVELISKTSENKIGRGFRRKRKKPVFPYMNTVFPFREKQALSLPSGREWNGGKYLRTHYTIIQLRDTASIACICLFFVKRKRQFRRLSHMWAQTTGSL